MKITTQECDKLLDDVNQTKELLQENIEAGSIAGNTITHIKAMIARVFEDMKTKEYKVIKNSINEIYQILMM